MYYSSGSSSHLHVRSFPARVQRNVKRQGGVSRRRPQLARRVIIGQIFIFYYFVGIEQRALCSGFREFGLSRRARWGIFIFRRAFSIKVIGGRHLISSFPIAMASNKLISRFRSRNFLISRYICVYPAELGAI